MCVIGAGVSGISAAWLLQTQSQTGSVHVTLMDQDPRLGGHAFTLEVLPGVNADLGFQVRVLASNCIPAWCVRVRSLSSACVPLSARRFSCAHVVLCAFLYRCSARPLLPACCVHASSRIRPLAGQSLSACMRA